MNILENRTNFVRIIRECILANLCHPWYLASSYTKREHIALSMLQYTAQDTKDDIGLLIYIL
jgi:hypothetical protein